MAFSDWLDLRTAVIEHIGRPDIADVFPRLTLLAEAAFNRHFRHRDQITSDTLTFASGVAALPADFLEMIAIYDSRGDEYPFQPVQGIRPIYTRTFAAVTGSNVEIRGFSGDLECDYYAKIPTITDGMTDTNWLLTAFPSVYLYGVGVEAAKYVKDLELAQATQELYRMALREADGADEQARYARARVRPQGATP